MKILSFYLIGCAICFFASLFHRLIAESKDYLPMEMKNYIIFCVSSWLGLIAFLGFSVGYFIHALKLKIRQNKRNKDKKIKK